MGSAAVVAVSYKKDLKAARRYIRAAIAAELEGRDFIGKSASPVWALTQLQREQAELGAALDDLQRQIDAMTRGIAGDIDAEWERLAAQWAL
jgi:hypothetical protein